MVPKLLISASYLELYLTLHFKGHRPVNYGTALKKTYNNSMVNIIILNYLLSFVLFLSHLFGQ